MSEIRDVDVAELLEIASSEQHVVVLVWVRSCSACSKFKPVYNQLPGHFTGVTFLRMNQLKTLENLRYSESKGMEETPTTFIYCKGEYLSSITGYHPLDQAVKKLGKLIDNCN